MPRIPVRVVTPLSGRVSASTALAVDAGEGYDVALGGIKFLLAASPETPYRRKTAQYRKEQLDTEAEPGEQSLSSWWLRSQESFHGGAGILYQEPLGEQNPSNRFRDSLGIDPWTPGQIKLLKSVGRNNITTGTTLGATAIDATNGSTYFWTDGAVFKAFSYPGGTVTISWGGVGNIVDLITGPASYYVADSVGIWSGTTAGGAGSKIWDTGTAAVKMGWVKQRLVAGIGNSVYELVGTGPTLPTALYTHPVASWKWTAITDGPDAIYAAGYAGNSSSIVKFALSSSGAMPTLTSATTVADLPAGETVRSLFSYLGKFLVIGTDKGVRIGVFQNDGSIQYGPLTIELPANSGPVTTFAGRDRFVWCNATNALPDGRSGLFRIDLSNEVEEGRFAWATDLQAERTGTVSSVFWHHDGPSFVGATETDVLMFTIDGAGVYGEAIGGSVSTGYLRTGRIRFRTLEPKLFKYVRVRTDAMKGSISIEAINDADTTAPVITYSTQGVSDQPEASIPSILGPQESFAFKFTLTANMTFESPVLRSYQVKALPAGKRQRLLTVPLLCYDRERTASGQFIGGDGHAANRFLALEALEEAGDAVTFQEFFSRDSDSSGQARVAVIEDLDFQQVAPPTGQETRGYGGILMATVRCID